MAEPGMNYLEVFINQNKHIKVFLISVIPFLTIPAHTKVLKHCLSYFNVKFNAKEQSKLCERVAALDDLIGDTLKAVVSCFERVILDATERNFSHLLALEEVLPRVAETCDIYINRNLSDNHCQQLQLAVPSLNKLPKKLNNFKKSIIIHFSSFAKTENFLNISKAALKELLSRDNLNVDSEKEVLDALLRWLEHDEFRRAHIDKLINHIRVEHVDPMYLSERLDSEYIVKFPQLQGLINMKYRHLINPTAIKRQPRLPCEETCVVITRNKFQNYIHQYHPDEDKWKALMKVDIPYAEGFAICSVNDVLIIAGGKYSNEVWSIDLDSKEVNNLKRMNTRRALFGLAVLNKCIYAVGGYSGNFNSTKSVERLDLSRGLWSTWSYVADMNVARRDHAVAVFEGLLYAVGGCDNFRPYNSVECYDPAADEWRECAPMNERRVYHEVAVLNNFLYAVGGYGNTVERYDPRIDKWTQICNLSRRRRHFACVALNGRLIVAGGDKDNSVELYNPELNVWESKKCFPLFDDCSGALAINI